ncbi:hypothetical protein DFJ58DRAFT_732824 [Suillus subalutaceus]|uniref:uncharacterized protein n=1 Tax=Suillus subalutaceus TaxID=48586 RepID=UPI001B866A7A|nr:uncharacterized protein DFJ58DRAFT_732824 [Suillus subalutaceus]KAG1840606.1 hypothetical protein DFJ58DRAFT_732824 [Suillus subalutaceus]
MSTPTYQGISDTATWEQIAILKDHDDLIDTISSSRNDRLLASASVDHTTRLWNLDINLPVGPRIQHEGDVRCAALSADGKLIFNDVTNGARSSRAYGNYHYSSARHSHCLTPSLGVRVRSFVAFGHLSVALLATNDATKLQQRPR